MHTNTISLKQNINFDFLNKEFNCSYKEEEMSLHDEYFKEKKQNIHMFFRGRQQIDFFSKYIRLIFQKVKDKNHFKNEYKVDNKFLITLSTCSKYAITTQKLYKFLNEHFLKYKKLSNKN